MKRAIAVAAISLAMIGSQTRADEHRGGDAALGALSGAVVLGPIGALAGAAVGYAAGPSIAHAWGFRRANSAAPRARAARQEAPTGQAHTGPAAASGPAPAPKTVASKTAAPKTASTAPPVQGLE